MSLIITNGTVTVTENTTDRVVFKGTEQALAKMIIDARKMAEYIRTDINAGLIEDTDDDLNGMAFETYNNFSVLYENYPK